MKKKLIIILITLFIISIPSNVKASITLTAYHGTYSNTSGIKMYRYGKQLSGATDYNDQIKYFTVGGKNVPAYCLDPGQPLDSGKYQYKCSPISDAGIVYLLNQFANIDTTKDKTAYTMAELSFRFYGIITSFGTDASVAEVIDGYTEIGRLRGAKEALIRYHQISVGAGEAMAEGCIQHKNQKCSTEKNDYFNDAGIPLVEEAYANATKAAEVKRGATSSTGTSSGGITFSLQSGASQSGMTYTLSSGTEFPQLDFKCENCTIVSKSWSGKSGQITIVPPADCGEFKILVYAQLSGAYVCIAKNASSNSHQMLITSFDETSTTSSTTVTSGASTIDTTGTPMQTYTSVGVGCQQDCCTESPIEAGKMFGAVYNCCYDDTHSEAREYDLNDLFCKDSELNVQHYFEKCDSEYYIDTDMTARLNDYCKMYCTERISVDVPGAIVATSGRYFDLNTTAQGTTSPYVEGYKRCRTIIDYDAWHKKYKETVEEEIKQYNSYQKNRAYELSYTEAIDNKEKKELEIKISCTWEGETTKSCDYSCTKSCTNELGLPDTCPDTCSESHSYSKPSNPSPYEATLTYYYYSKYNLSYYKYQTVKMDDTKENDSSHIHNSITIKYDTTETPSASPLNWSDTKGDNPKDHSEWTGGVAYYNQYNGQTETKTQTGKCSTSTTFTLVCNSMPSFTTTDVYNIRDTYKDNATSANASYNAAADTAKDLEDKIDKCDYYFTKYEGADAEQNYDFDASFEGFQYSQQYIGDFGTLETDISTIMFSSSPGCEIEGPTLGPDSEDGLVSPQYSDAAHYNTGEEIMIDFKNTKLEWGNSTTWFSQYLHEEYDADKKFVQDAKYHATCSWDEPTNINYTLIPRGSVEETTFNFTENERQYSIYLTTLNGTFDTQWLLSGLGSRSDDGTGKFDEFFAKNGEVCSVRQNATDDGLFHCGIRVDHEIIETGKCTPDGDGYTVVSQEECDPIDGPEPVFVFKVADPKNLFPSCSSGSCDYGYNWFYANKGPETLAEIQNRGNRDETYSSANVSYSYTLTSNDLRTIKEYNSYREQDSRGGYSDFTLVCDCPEEAETCNEVGGTNTCKRSESCTKCRSTFLTNIYNGYVQYDGSSHSVTPGIGNIETIRSSAHWAG